MDKLTKYRQIICDLLSQQAEIVPLEKNIESETIFDEKWDRYLLLHLGWDGQKRIYSVLLHLEIREEKIWIQENNTDILVAEILLEKGVKREDIILGLKPAFVREYTGFGVA
ncbi:XisI protein [Cyanobacterium stanieri LEGE 03274]|uniref:XisI protein n=1 Tax=Cyanobacterium stanieri LEGE 03274 TaxID=1828756 RepID=A0ABR9V7G9_9CHRO|nr:XisI protein [Cyanobacterium stanieri]MBE9223843.1 XisI protein [Cyanobacterium stanieri LEGE 03274]